MASTLAEDLSKGSTHHGQTSYDGKGLSSKFPPNAPIIARAKFETVANTLNVSLANCGVILVGHPKTEQLSRNRDCEKERASERIWSKRSRLEWSKWTTKESDRKSRMPTTAFQRRRSSIWQRSEGRILHPEQIPDSKRSRGLPTCAVKRNKRNRTLRLEWNELCPCRTTDGLNQGKRRF